MKNEPHIVWKGLTPSPALDERIRKELAELDKTYRRITACRVVLETPHKHRRHGRHFAVKIELSVPGKVLNVTRDPDEQTTSSDPYAAVNDAFWAMRRQLEDYIRVRRGLVKQRGDEPHLGVVSKLVPEDECGFISDDEGEEVYFHKNSVLDGAWRGLDVGARVRFHPERGDRGPQASSVHVMH